MAECAISSSTVAKLTMWLLLVLYLRVGGTCSFGGGGGSGRLPSCASIFFRSKFHSLDLGSWMPQKIGVLEIGSYTTTLSVVYRTSKPWSVRHLVDNNVSAASCTMIILLMRPFPSMYCVAIEYEFALPYLTLIGAGSLCLVSANLVASTSAMMLIVAPLSDAPMVVAVISFSSLVRWACGLLTSCIYFQNCRSLLVEGVGTAD